MGADISLTGGSFGRQDIKAVAQIPLIEDTLGLKLFGASIQHDGHVRSTTSNRDVGGDDKTNYGFTVLWEANDEFDLKVHHEDHGRQQRARGLHQQKRLARLACTLIRKSVSILPMAVKQTPTTALIPQSLTAEFQQQRLSNNHRDAQFQHGSFSVHLHLFLRDMDEQNMQDFDGAPSSC